MLIHFTWLRKAGTKQCRIQCPARDGDLESHLQRNAISWRTTPPPTPGLPVDGALVQGRRFPAITTQLGVHTPSLTPTAPGALLRAEIQGGLSRSQLRLLMRAVLETAEKEAAASAVVSLHSASALRSTGDRQQPTSPPGKRHLRPAHFQRWCPRPTIAGSAARLRLRRGLVHAFPTTFLSRGIVPFLWFRGLCCWGPETAERNWISPLRVQAGGGGELKQNDLKRVPGCGVCFFRTILAL
ncbi:TPA: hypothetical protein BOS_10876 [Bos taurus]|nr:TPA: hypothetical protein BOS_10876 [Bos taurus]